MTLMGGTDRWLPSWLDRRLPRIDIEGGKLPRADRVDIEPVGATSGAPAQIPVGVS